MAGFIDEIQRIGAELLDIRKDQTKLDKEVSKLKLIDTKNIVYKGDCEKSHEKIDKSMCSLSEKIDKIQQDQAEIKGKLQGQGDIVGRILTIVEAQQKLIADQANGVLSNKKSTLAILGTIATVGGAILVKVADFVLSKVNI